MQTHLIITERLRLTLFFLLLREYTLAINREHMRCPQILFVKCYIENFYQRSRFIFVAWGFSPAKKNIVARGIQQQKKYVPSFTATCMFKKSKQKKKEI